MRKKNNIALLRLSRNIKSGVLVPMSIASSPVGNFAFSEHLQDTGDSEW